MNRPADWEKEEERLAAASLAAHDPTGWFDQLYAAAASGDVQMPWSRIEPHPLLTGWVQDRNLTGAGRQAVVVGCGLGADAEYLQVSSSTPLASISPKPPSDSPASAFPDPKCATSPPTFSISRPNGYTVLISSPRSSPSRPARSASPLGNHQYRSPGRPRRDAISHCRRP
jgi:hypothetical protein